MGMEQVLGFQYPAFEPVRTHWLINNKMAQPRFVEKSGTYTLHSVESVGQGDPRATLCYNFPQTLRIKSESKLKTDYDWYCFTLMTHSDLLDGMFGVKTSVLVRLVEPADRASLLLNAKLSHFGHSFTDRSFKLNVVVKKINSTSAELVFLVQ